MKKIIVKVYDSDGMFFTKIQSFLLYVMCTFRFNAYITYAAAYKIKT